MPFFYFLIAPILWGKRVWHAAAYDAVVKHYIISRRAAVVVVV